MRAPGFGMNLIMGHAGTILHCAEAGPLHKIDGTELDFAPSALLQGEGVVRDADLSELRQ
jgi:hypothetical protein